MRNHFFTLLFFLLFIVTLSHGQQWDSVGNGVGCNWNSSCSGCGYVQCLKVINSDLYIGGGFGKNCGAPGNGIVKYNGYMWVEMPGLGPLPNTIEWFDSNIYVGGQGFFNDNLQKWNGSSWGPVSDSAPQNTSPDAPVLSLQRTTILMTLNNKLYVGGQTGFQTVGGINCNHIAAWDGSAWDDAGGGVNGGFWPEVRAMAVYKNELYIGGSFDWAGNSSFTVKNIARWNGIKWDSVKSGLPTSAIIYSMIPDTISDLLYVAGAYSVTGNYHQVAIWNNNEWSYLPPLGMAVSSNGMTFYRNKLFIGGGYGKIFSWDGIKWSVVIGPNNSINSLAAYNDWLYVGGYFDSVMTNSGPMEVNYLARYYEPPCYGMAAEIGFLNKTVYLSDSALVQFYDSSAGLHKSGWQWYFGGTAASNLQNPVNSFPAAGIYPVMMTLTYTPPDTCISTAYDVVTVINDCNSVKAYFSTSADTAVIDSTGKAEIQFSDSSINAKYVKWYFGDGAESADTNPTHQYDSAGIYDVILVVNKGLCYDSAYKPLVIMDVGIKELPVPGSEFRVYPNPNGGSFTIEFLNKNFRDKEYRMEIYNTKGHLARELTIRNTKTAIRKLEKGVYFIKVLQGGKVAGIEKVVVE